jgi:hypothetical protein
MYNVTTKNSSVPHKQGQNQLSSHTQFACSGLWYNKLKLHAIHHSSFSVYLVSLYTFSSNVLSAHSGDYDDCCHLVCDNV